MVGVLIALGAQQAADAWNARRDVAEFRAALNAELSNALGAYAGRMMQNRCVELRLAQLDRWQRAWRDGSGTPSTETIGRPLAFGFGDSVWKTGASGVAGRMPLDERLGYAQVYDSLEGYDGLRLREVETWQKLYAYDGARTLSPAEVNVLRGLILQANSTQQSMVNNWPRLREAAAQLGASVPDDLPPVSDTGLCPRTMTRADGVASDAQVP